MAEDLVLSEKKGNVAIITLNRPRKRNAVSYEMALALDEQIDKAAEDDEVRVVVLRGEGPGFSAGIDFNMLTQISTKYSSTPVFRYFLPKLQEIFNKMETMEKPVIAALHGFCFGLGLEMALAADFRIAAEGTEIALQETEIGLIPDVGGTTRLTRTVGIPLAKEIIMTSRRLNARKALDIHLVNEVVPRDELMPVVMRWVERLENCAPLAIGLAKKIIDRGAHLDKLTFMALEGLAQSALIQTDDVKEGVMAKIQKRKPEFKGK